MAELSALSDDVRQADETTVCPEHLWFVPCRRCSPGTEQYATDPVDVARTIRFQHGTQAAASYWWDRRKRSSPPDSEPRG